MEQNQEEMSSNRIQNNVLDKEKKKRLSYKVEKKARLTLQETLRIHMELNNPKANG